MIKTLCYKTLNLWKCSKNIVFPGYDSSSIQKRSHNYYATPPPFYPYQTEYTPIIPSNSHYPSKAYFYPSSHPIKLHHPPNYPIFAANDIKFTHKKVRVDDAPQPVYGVALRSRRFFSCDEEFQEECEALEAQGDVVDCKQPRFRFVYFLVGFFSLFSYTINFSWVTYLNNLYF